MSAQRSWPQRYLVRITGSDASTLHTYKVVTWLDEAKARSMALDAHRVDHPTATAATVEVEDLGPVARDERGQMAIERDAIIDRMEF